MGIQNPCTKIPLIFIIIFLCNFARSIADKEAKKAVIVCSYQEWAKLRDGEGRYTVNEIPVHYCTHIRYAFLGLNAANWSVNILSRQFESLGQLRDLKKLHPHLKLNAAIGGIEAEIYSQMLSKFDRREKFINSLLKFLTDFDFDGVSTSNPSQNSADNFYNLISELKRAFNIANKGWELVISLPVSEAKLSLAYQLPELCDLADFIYAETFDLRGNWQGFTDVPAPLRRRPQDINIFKNLNVQEGAGFLVQKGCVRSKIVVSVSFTGRSYILQEGSTNFGIRANIDKGTKGIRGPWLNEFNGVLGYNEICYEILRNHSRSWTKNWDNLGKSPFMHKDSVWIGYEDPDSIQYKMEFIRENGYAGTMIWSVDTDDFMDYCGYGKNILSSLVHRHLKDYVVP